MNTVVRKSKDFLLGRLAFIIGLLWLSLLSFIHFWPASWWLDVDSVRVADGVSGQPVVMYVQRTIYRDFTGTWGVSVRSLTDQGSMVACAASAVSDYRIGAYLPEVLTLGWWTNGRCETLPAGTYLVQTTWQIHGNGILPVKTISTASNIFKVS